MLLRSNKEVNSLISKKMSNVYLNSSNWAKLKFSKFQFSEPIKSRLQVKFLRAPAYTDFIEL